MPIVKKSKTLMTMRITYGDSTSTTTAGETTLLVWLEIVLRNNITKVLFADVTVR